MAHTVTGTGSSRLSELRKLTKDGGSIASRYFTSNNPSNDGVNISLTTEGVTWTYYIGGITYVDNVETGITSFIFQSQGYADTNNFIDLPIIKDPAKENIIDIPEINNNVFIIRQSLPVFENIYRLEGFINMFQLESYAGGNNYNIIENS